MKKTLLLLSVLAIATTLQAGSKFTEWSAPTNLGPAVNSSYVDFAPAISKNGLSLYFSSDRPDQNLGVTDLYVSQRSSTAEPWGPPVNLGPTINSSKSDEGPALSRDGHYLFFSSNRPGGLGGTDIWVSYRENTHDDFAWETPKPITEINSSKNDAGPTYFENEGGRPQLYFQSPRPGGAGAADIYLTEQQEDGTWSAPVRVAELSSPFQEQRPSIRFDGLEIVFASNRGNPLESVQLWVSTRPSVTVPWSKPTLLENVNSGESDDTPCLSGDGLTLYFASNRDGGTGHYDVWVSTRERKRGNE